MLPQSCSRYADAPGDDGSPPAFSNILVYPFQNMTALYGGLQTVRSPISGKIFMTGDVESHAADFMTLELMRVLSRKPSIRSTIYSGKSSEVGQDQDLIDRLQQTGRLNHSDALLIGYLYVFEERVGGNYGVEHPARVSFELNLIEVHSGRLAWQRSFIETQQALNENLFELKKFIQRKGRWVTAREMAVHALEEMLRDNNVF
jgi:hypothetical protein